MSRKCRAPSDALLLKGHTVKSDSMNEFKGKNKPLEYKGNQQKFAFFVVIYRLLSSFTHKSKLNTESLLFRLNKGCVNTQRMDEQMVS